MHTLALGIAQQRTHHYVHLSVLVGISTIERLKD